MHISSSTSSYSIHFQSIVPDNLAQPLPASARHCLTLLVHGEAVTLWSTIVEMRRLRPDPETTRIRLNTVVRIAARVVAPILTSNASNAFINKIYSIKNLYL